MSVMVVMAIGCAEMSSYRILRATRKTKRQVRKFLFEHDIIIKNGTLYRVPSMIVVRGYVERLQSGEYTICVSVKKEAE